MTQEQFDVRLKRAEKELFVISPAEDGWRVRSAHNPSQYYLVSAEQHALFCSCPDFETLRHCHVHVYERVARQRRATLISRIDFVSNCGSQAALQLG